MPISEDEYERCSVNEATSTMSKAEIRKTHKPIMEKRRRARINQCLNEIKSLILEALKKDPARHSKLEKADILEMAVKHLQNVQRQQLAMAMAGDPSVLRKFKTGFNECADEVTSYISQTEGTNSSLKQRVSTHLTKCITGIEQIAQLNVSGLGPAPFLSNPSNFFASALSSKAAESDVVGDQNNNPRVHIPQGIQLIPSRLPSGEIAFLVPNSRNLECFSGLATQNQNKSLPINLELNKNNGQRGSAFVSVIPSSTSSSKKESFNIIKPLSPPLSPPNYNNQNDDVMIVSEDFSRRSPPRGFRPVNAKLHKSYQSAFISTANLGQKSSPNKYNCQEASSSLESRNFSNVKQKYLSLNKLGEPLSIITNHNERFKQAQVPDDAVNFEENMRHGVKRKYMDVVKDHQGLLTVSSSELDYTCSSKIPKASKEFYPSHYRSPETSGSPKNEDSKEASTSKLSSEMSGGSKLSDSGNDMWRPW